MAPLQLLLPQGSHPVHSLLQATVAALLSAVNQSSCPLCKCAQPKVKKMSKFTFILQPLSAAASAKNMSNGIVLSYAACCSHAPHYVCATHVKRLLHGRLRSSLAGQPCLHNASLFPCPVLDVLLTLGVPLHAVTLPRGAICCSTVCPEGTNSELVLAHSCLSHPRLSTVHHPARP